MASCPDTDILDPVVSGPGHEAMSRGPSTVLVIDDTPGNRYAVAHTLRSAGMRVIEGGTGADALRLAKGHPDLIVLDINLPDISGYEVARALKASADTAAIPVLHVSATYVGSTDRAAGLESGADAYLTHPIDPVVFIATVNALLRAGRAEARLRAAADEWVAIFDAISDAVFLLDPHGLVVRCNQSAAALLQRHPREVAGHDIVGLINRTFGDHAGEPLGAAAGSAPTREREVRIGDAWYLVAADRLNPEHEESRTVLVLTDIGLRKAAEREREELLRRAEAARYAAESANRAKAEFLTTMSHELRTPLNAISGYAALLADGMRGPVTAEQGADLARVRRAAAHLLGLINDVLNFAKLESAQVTLSRERVEIRDLVGTAVSMVAPQATAKEIALGVSECVAGVAAHGDPDKVLQVILNLLSNAIKFTDGGGRVVVACSSSEAMSVVTVHDTGRGIPGDRLESIFEPFVQVGRRLSALEQGVGLGLAISRDLARGMGGDLTAESELGVGSTFTLTLPRA